MNYKEELLNDIVPFWLNNAVDFENGGIFTQLDEKGNIYGTEKSVWFQGRSLWTFSKIYNEIKKDKRLLEASKCIYEFLPKCTDTDGRMYFTVTKEGKGLQKRRYYFSETFAAIGCAQYYKATGNEDARKNAEKYFNVAYECFKGIRKTEPKINPENSKTKALSPVMIMLSTASEMRGMNDENKEKYNDIVTECLNEIIEGGFLKENALLECVNADGSFSDTPAGRVVNPGHSLEASWFIMHEGIYRNDKNIVDVGKKIIDFTLPLGLDKKHGGIIAFTDVNGKPPVQLEWDMKLWWPQCEAIIALKTAYNFYKEEKYNEKCEELEKYCEKYFKDSQNGEWYGYLHYDNTVSTTLKGNIFKGPFHIPRLYIIMSQFEERS